MSNTIDPGLFYSNRPNQTKETGNSILGKDDFLRILIAQLQNQDPTNPMDDREFIAQMAQFSSLEQMTNMNRQMERFVASQMDSKMFQFSHMIGKEVRYVSGTDLNERPVFSTAVVESISQKGDKVAIKLSNGLWVSEDEIVEIRGVPKKEEATQPVENGGGNSSEQGSSNTDSEPQTDSGDEPLEQE